MLSKIVIIEKNVPQSLYSNGNYVKKKFQNYVRETMTQKLIKKKKKSKKCVFQEKKKKTQNLDGFLLFSASITNIIHFFVIKIKMFTLW